MKLTVAFTLLVIALVTIYDVWTLAMRGYETTISWTIFVASQGWPIIPFAIGVLAGHLFFPNRAARLDGTAPKKIP